MPLVSNLMAPCEADVLSEAEALCHQQLRDRPDQPDRLHLLGLIAARSARPDLALACLGRAALLEPTNLTYHLDLGDTLAAVGRLQQAHAAYTSAICLASADPRPHRGAGRALAGLGRPTDAALALAESLRLDPSHGATYGDLGDIHGREGRWRDALLHYERWRQLSPDGGTPYARVGRAHLALQGPIEAEQWFRRGLSIDDQLVELHLGLGTVLLRRGAMAEALRAFRAALTIEPLNLSACQWFIQAAELAGCADEGTSGWYRLGCALEARHLFSDAEAAFQRALGRNPQSIVTMLRLADVELRLKRPAEAARLCERAVALRPDSRLAHVGLGMAAQALGDLRRGWREFLWYQQHDAEEARDFEQPLWDGSPLDGRTILLWSDWALGDAIQFARYAPLVAARGGRVVLECQPTLVSLFSGIPGVARAVARQTALPAFDVHAPLFSLPRIFDTALDSIPDSVPYVAVEDSLGQEWARRLKPRPQLTVGVVWAGEPDRPNARLRFTTLSQWAPLAAVQDVRFISLQQGRASIELVAPPQGLQIERLDTDPSSIADTAAIIQALDLVITVDTMVAHLAGALGCPVWTLLHHGPDWRWQCEGESTRWYPTMRLFRQARPADWHTVMERVRDELAALVARGVPSTTATTSCLPTHHG